MNFIQGASVETSLKLTPISALLWSSGSICVQLTLLFRVELSHNRPHYMLLSICLTICLTVCLIEPCNLTTESLRKSLSVKVFFMCMELEMQFLGQRSRSHTKLGYKIACNARMKRLRKFKLGVEVSYATFSSEVKVTVSFLKLRHRMESCSKIRIDGRHSLWHVRLAG